MLQPVSAMQPGLAAPPLDTTLMLGSQRLQMKSQVLTHIVFDVDLLSLMQEFSIRPLILCPDSPL